MNQLPRLGEGQQEIASRSPYSKIVLTNSGHEVPLEAPEVVIAAIRSLAQ